MKQYTQKKYKLGLQNKSEGDRVIPIGCSRNPDKADIKSLKWKGSNGKTEQHGENPCLVLDLKTNNICQIAIPLSLQSHCMFSTVLSSSSTWACQHMLNNYFHGNCFIKNPSQTCGEGCHAWY